MSSIRPHAVSAGVLFLVAAAASIPALALYQPALSDPDYVLGAGADGQVLLGGLLEAVTAAAVVGTGVALYPLLRRGTPAAAAGYLAGRVLEAAMIAVGMVATLALVSLRQEVAAGLDPAGAGAVARALVALHDWTFLAGPGLAIGVNTALLAWAVRRAGLAPRWITTTGLVGGPLVLASSTLIFVGAYPHASVPGFLAAVPVLVWEMTLAVHLLRTGRRAQPAAPEAQPTTADARPALDTREPAARR